LFPSAFTIAFLAGVESLLSAVVADGMIGGRHRSNCELVAQGIANIASSLFGGLPATGALARTAANARAGARSPIAGMAHALFLLMFTLVLAPLMSYVPSRHWQPHWWWWRGTWRKSTASVTCCAGRWGSRGAAADVRIDGDSILPLPLRSA
jgi:hypothetical protein